MVFTVQTLYFLSPFTNPTLKLPPYRNLFAFVLSQKNSFCMIYKPFDILWHWGCTDRSPSPCNTHVIPMSLYKLVSSYVTKTNKHTHIQNNQQMAGTFHNTNTWQKSMGQWRWLNIILNYYLSNFAINIQYKKSAHYFDCLTAVQKWGLGKMWHFNKSLSKFAQ